MLFDATICITCAGNRQTRKPDAVNPRQVDAVVQAFIYMSHRNDLGFVCQFSLSCQLRTTFP
jgi:hypothetical protein